MLLYNPLLSTSIIDIITYVKKDIKNAGNKIPLNKSLSSYDVVSKIFALTGTTICNDYFSYISEYKEFYGFLSTIIAKMQLLFFLDILAVLRKKSHKNRYIKNSRTL